MSVPIFTCGSRTSKLNSFRRIAPSGRPFLWARSARGSTIEGNRLSSGEDDWAGTRRRRFNVGAQLRTLQFLPNRNGRQFAVIAHRKGGACEPQSHTVKPVAASQPSFEYTRSAIRRNAEQIPLWQPDL